MRFERATLNVPSGNGTGTAQDVRDWIDKWVACTGTFSATVNIGMSMDGTNWIDFGAGTADTVTEIPQAVGWLRVVTSGYTSGGPVLSVAGRNARTD